MSKESGENKNETSEKKKSWFTPKRVFLGVLSLGALGFGFWYATRKTNKPGGDDGLTFDDSGADAIDSGGTTTETGNNKPKKKTSGGGSSTVPKLPASDFPLKKGMPKNDKVKVLQEKLKAKNPGLVADGVFGSKTEAALIAAGLPTVISEAQFKVLTAVDPETTATTIYNAAKKKDFKTAIATLNQIKTVSDYSAVSDQFKQKPALTPQFQNQSLVNGMLYTFTDPNQKDLLNVAFTTMGLEKKDGKWYVPSGVSGIERKTIITKWPTKVWHDAKHMVNVGANTILGYEVRSGDGITVFDTIDGYRLYVVTASVKYN